MKMTVKQLIKELKKWPEDMQVALSKDEEGNGFSGYIDVEDMNNIVVLWPGGQSEIDELEDYIDDEREE